MLAGLLFVAVGYIVLDKVFISQRPVETEVASTVTEKEPVAVDVEEATKTIAVLPFENLSSDPEQEYFVDGLSEELLNCLAKIGGLRVTSRTSSFAFKGAGKTLQDVASVLGVDHILEGSVRKSGDSLRITAQLIRVEDDFHLWSETYARELKDIFDLQEEIAIAVSNELKVKLGIGETFKQLGGTDNVDAYELYLASLGKFHEDNYSASKLALESIDEAIALDSEFGLAWGLKGKIHIHISANGPPDIVVLNQNEAIIAVQRAFELESGLAIRYYSVLSQVKRLKGDFAGAESGFRKAIELTNESVEYGVGIHYISLGYLEKANQLFEEARQSDPMDQAGRGWYLYSISLLDDIQQAEEEYARGRALFGDEWIWGNLAITWLRLSTGEMVTPSQIICSDDPKCIAIKEHLGSPKDALEKLYRIYSAYDNPKSSELADLAVWVAYCGDTEFAMDLLEESFTIDYSRQNFIWLPLMHKVRQLPRFKEYMRGIGLVDFWNQFGWPDLCRPLDNGDFVCE
jgi:TolB-like protein